MSPLHALRKAAGLGHTNALGASVALAGPTVPKLPDDATALLGAHLDAIGDGRARDWLTRVAGWLTGTPQVDLDHPVQVGRHALWVLLGTGNDGFSSQRLEGAVPEGSAWLVALEPERFFAQAADRLEAAGGPRAERLAGRLRQPTGNLAMLARMVSSAALSLELSDPATASLRLRVVAPDLTGAVQASVLLHAWRARRAGREDEDAQSFARASVHRRGARVEVAFTGTAAEMSRLIVPSRG
jgi:hypothetical protein